MINWLNTFMITDDVCPSRMHPNRLQPSQTMQPRTSTQFTHTQTPWEKEPKKTKVFGGMATALALILAFGTWFFPDIRGLMQQDLSGDPMAGVTEPSSPTGKTSTDPDESESVDWVLHFEDLELELPPMQTDENSCAAGLIDLNTERPEPVLLESRSLSADLSWGLCANFQDTWEGAERCNADEGCILAGDVSMAGNNPAAVVSEVEKFDAEACSEAAERGGTARNGQGNNDRWNIRLLWNEIEGVEYVSGPARDGICIDTSEEVFRIEFGELEYTYDKIDGTIYDVSLIVYVTSWTPA
ncbi:hypothetical protein [Brevibacterium sp.]|uniref:hypothetical protein n=1 Tax=Brevibacterium sp. TaxID=1701 RepID=UPI002639524A|nr:hypothetical protein [Brevibacterium sp.]